MVSEPGIQMERKGGCRLAPRYGPAGQMGNIMLKFRPIAPKPAAMAPAPMPAPVTPAGPRKGKRKAVAVAGGGGKRGRKPKKAAATVAVVTTATEATPKVDVHKDKPLSSPSSPSSGMTSVDSSTPPPPPPPATLTHAPSSLAFSALAPMAADLALAPQHVLGHVPPLQPLRPVASCVTVESVTGTWRDGEVPPYACARGSDEAPAFVSDQWGRVTWMNLAFNRAVSGGGTGNVAAAPSAAPDAGVVLAAKDGAAVAWSTCAGFTCRVRVTYACPRRSSLVAPCDVWRLDAGGYLWRLDLQATLSLGGLL